MCDLDGLALFAFSALMVLFSGLCFSAIYEGGIEDN